MNARQIIITLGTLSAFAVSGMSQEIVGTNVTSHHYSAEMKWRKPPNPELSAKVELFLKNTQGAAIELDVTNPPRFDGLTATQLLQDSTWAWHATPESWLDTSVSLPPESMTVFTVNGISAAWGVGTQHELHLPGATTQAFRITKPDCWLSSVTFLAKETEKHDAASVSLKKSFSPNKIVVHITNDGANDLRLHSVKLWLPKKGESHRVFFSKRSFARNELSCFPKNGVVAAQDKGGFTVLCDPLPLTYGVVEVVIQRDPDSTRESLWAHLRIKRETFDISGGWVASDLGGRNSLSINEYLMTLKRMHINTGHIQEVGGFTDDPQRYARLPLKRFNRLWPLDKYDRDEMLPTIHAVEFLGEPQYGGGRPVPPQEVWEKLAPYEPGRLPTTLTLSEERSWRYYAGLSDYPHYDAYRVTAPAADSWQSYKRWNGEHIRWAAPLETIGTMTRSLREHSRPRPIAYRSQGAHDGWGSRWNPRRSSPTPDELRSQAWHGLANRITSLYWFNLSLKSLVKFPDLIEPITRVNREIRMLEEIFLNGAAFEHRRLKADGRPSWDLTSIAAPTTVLLAAHDLQYQADLSKREFVFSERPDSIEFRRPTWLGELRYVFRIDADGTHDVTHTLSANGILIEDSIKIVGIYVATSDKTLRDRLDRQHAALLAKEHAVAFNPANDKNDLELLLEHATN